MPFKNNRNSRDDKSKKADRTTKSSKDFAPKSSRNRTERTDSTSVRPKKLFGISNEIPLKSDSKRGAESPFGQGIISERASDPKSERPFKRPENKRFEKSDNKSSGRIVNKPFGKSDDKKFGRSGDRKIGSTGAKKIWTKSADSSGDERGPSRYGKSDTGRPFSKTYKPRAPYSTDDRKNATADRSERKLGGKGKKSPVEKIADDGLIRLNRYIANAGICSRRKADELIQAGVVSVNGEVVSELGTKVDPSKDLIRYNGETLKRERMVYVLLNKPKDYITTTDDPQERRTVMELVEKASRERIYPVGRLDRNTTGLLLMTNDGALAEKLSHPKSNITKLYQVELNKNLVQGDLNKISFGLELEDGPIKPDAVSYVQGGSKKEIGIQIHSGRNRVVRRIFEHLGYEVVKLDRVVYGSLTKKDLTRGRWRYLEEKEIVQLKHLIK